jgi:hypothetical protein
MKATSRVRAFAARSKLGATILGRHQLQTNFGPLRRAFLFAQSLAAASIVSG